MNSNDNKLKGQILLITLFVLTIMALLLVITIRTILTDRKQSESNRDFEIFYNVSETITQDYIEGYVDATLSELANSCEGSAYNARTIHECSFEVDPTNLAVGSASTGQKLQTKVTVEEKSLVEVSLVKDEAFSLELTERTSPTTAVTYAGNVQVEWEGSFTMVMDVFVFYFNDTNRNLEYDSVTEDIAVSYALVDINNFLTVLPRNNYQINVNYNESTNKSTMTIPISTAMNYPTNVSFANKVPSSMVIIPRFNTPEEIMFTIKEPNHIVGPNASHPWPVQLRKITVETYDNFDPDSPVSKVTSEVPRFPQMNALFYYSLLSTEELNLPTGI